MHGVLRKACKCGEAALMAWHVLQPFHTSSHKHFMHTLCFSANKLANRCKSRSVSMPSSQKVAINLLAACTVLSSATAHRRGT
jgi:adenosylmethionine-8-amino-7-oxononanoate aminotransferase